MALAIAIDDSNDEKRQAGSEGYGLRRGKTFM